MTDARTQAEAGLPPDASGGAGAGLAGGQRGCPMGEAIPEVAPEEGGEAIPRPSRA